MSMKYMRWLSGYAATITPVASESNSVYPASNLGLERLSKCWRSNGGLSSIDITMDLTAARAIDLVGLANHNFTSAATVAIAAGTTNAYASYSDSMTYRAGTIYKVLSATQTYRYWRIRITDAANSDGFLEAGNLLLGALTTPLKGVSMDPGITIERISQNNVVESDFGTPFVDWLNNRKRISLSFRNMGTTERDDYTTFVDALAEEANPLFLIPDSTVYDGWYVRLQGSPMEQRQFYSNAPSLNFLEDGSGKRMGA